MGVKGSKEKDVEICDGVAGWEEEPKRERCHIEWGSSGEAGAAGEEERDVEEEEARQDVSSAPEDVTSWEVLEPSRKSGVLVSGSDVRWEEKFRMTVLMLKDFLCRGLGARRPEALCLLVWRVGVLEFGDSGALFWDTGRRRLVRF